MLRRLEIRDLALIEEAVLEPGAGLTVLSGETGAGKSLLIGAIKGMTGARMGREWVRQGSERASLDAVWDDIETSLPEELLTSIREEGGDDDELYISREILAEGRSVNRLDGRLCPLGRLRDVGSYLADIHGQHDTQAIFKAETHLGMLDTYGRQTIQPLHEAYHKTWQALQDLRQREKELVADPEARARILDQLRFQSEELMEANLVAGEDEALMLEQKKLSRMDRYREQLSRGLQVLSGDDDNYSASDDDLPAGVLPGLAETEQALLEAAEIEPELAQLTERILVIREDAEELFSKVSRHLELAEADPERLEAISRRLDLLVRLKRKYGGSIERMIRYRDQALAKLEDLEAGEAKLEELARRRSRLEALLLDQGLKLRRARQTAGEALAKAIGQELNDLGMTDAEFAVHFAERSLEAARADGMDEVEFLLSANPGEKPLPLARIASGGEAARIVLAIKVILAEADPLQLLVFDEIDSGVSGGTASQVGRKLWQLGRSHQVLCVTHSAQIAALADQHILIHKSVRDGRTLTRLDVLDEQGREQELARILAGDTVTDEAIRNARDLRLRAKQFREQYAQASPEHQGV